MLKNNNFALLFFGRLVSRLGDSIFQIGIAWYVLELTGSAVIMSSIIAVMFITMIIGGPIGGNIVDQFPKVKLLYWMDYIRGFVVIITAVTILFSNNTLLILIIIYFLAIISSLCSAVFNPASSAIIPLIVKKENLMRANSLMSITGSITSIVGILLGGILYGLLGPFGVILFDGISYILSAVSEMYIKLTEDIEDHISTEPMKEQWEIFKEGLNYLRGHVGLIYIGIFATLLNFALSPTFQIYQPYLIKEVLGKDIMVLTTLSIVSSAGMLAGGLFMSFFSSTDPKTDIMRLLKQFSLLLVIFLFISFFLVYDITRNKTDFTWFIIWFNIIAFITGVIIAVINIPIDTYIQKNTEPSMMGRVNSVINTLSFASLPLGLVIGGLLVELVTVEIAYLINALILLGITIMLLLSKKQISTNEEKPIEDSFF